LTGVCLESILWNKVPVELQQEAHVTHFNGTEVLPEGYQASVATKQQETVNVSNGAAEVAEVVAGSEKHGDVDQSSLPTLTVPLAHAVQAVPQQIVVVGVSIQEPVDKE